MAINEQPSTAGRSPTELYIVEPPQPIFVRYDEDRPPSASLNTDIATLVSRIESLYQSHAAPQYPDAAAEEPGQHESRPTNKRRAMAVLMFNELGLINKAVNTDVVEKAYDAAEAAVRTPGVKHTDIVDLVEKHIEHPVIQTTLRLRETQRRGALADDALTVQRAAALLIDSIGDDQA